MYSHTYIYIIYIFMYAQKPGDIKNERPTPPALENTVKTMLWSNPHKIGNIYYERIFVLSDQATI